MSLRAVKIIATVGPACAQENQMRDLIAAGVNLFRFNFAHGAREEHAARMAQVKQLAEEARSPIGILADISGPKIRLGAIPNDRAVLMEGQQVTLVAPGTKAEGWSVNLEDFDQYVQPGDPIYLADGTLRLTTLATRGGEVRAVVEVGGAIASFKGINLPYMRKPLPAVGEKDLLDVECALKAGADWIGLSFVASPEDVRPIHELMARLQLKRPVLAKLERRQALERLSEIIAAFDGVMVARGDLGIEVEFEKVPVLQDRILRLARAAGKPAVVATQILTSMISNPRPTRAEATDIAFAVSGGADALMLSEETAVGKYPVEAVRTVDKVAREIETVDLEDWAVTESLAEGEEPAMAHTAAILAHDVRASAILCPTSSGNAARAIARFRAPAPVVVVSDSAKVVGELTLYRGLHPRQAPLAGTLDGRIRTAVQLAHDLGLARPGSKLVVLGGVPAGSGRINLLLVHTMPGN